MRRDVSAIRQAKIACDEKELKVERPEEVDQGVTRRIADDKGKIAGREIYLDGKGKGGRLLSVRWVRSPFFPEKGSRGLPSNLKIL